MSRRTPITQRAFQGIAAGIGLVSESITAHKAKKQNQTNEPSLEDSATRETPSEGVESPVHEHENATQDQDVPETSATELEEQWALDEIQEELQLEDEDSTTPPKYTEVAEPVNELDLATQFTTSHPLPPPYTLEENVPLARLSAPVVLPQRRPKNRDRGFIRAYAPALGECGIDQETFIDFLDTAEKACRATPWLRTINLASIGTMWLPSVTGIAVSIAIQIATDAAMAVDGRRKSNTFFDKMNKEFFQPRGLFCLVMTWNPELPDAPSTAIDLNALITQAAAPNSGKLGRLQQKFKSSDGKAYGNIFPEVAPLVFPSIDQLASDPDAEKKVSKMKKKGKFVSGYMDKRAQAKFMAENPDSHLNQGQNPTFTSRYADPNHPASSGDPLALITGGNITLGKLQGLKNGRSRGIGGRRGYLYDSQDGSPGSSSSPAPHAPYGRRLGLRDAVAMAKDIRNPQQSTGSSLKDEPFGRRISRARGQKERYGLLTPVKKLLKKDVMYLAIVNMPSEEEMARAYEAVNQMG